MSVFINLIENLIQRFLTLSNTFHILPSLLIFLSYGVGTSEQTLLLSTTEDTFDISGHSIFFKKQYTCSSSI